MRRDSRDLDASIAAARAWAVAKREASKTTFERSPGGLIRWQGMVWGGPHKARKPTTCAWSGREIGKGAAIYAPISNSNKRMLRVLSEEWATS